MEEEDEWVFSSYNLYIPTGIEAYLYTFNLYGCIQVKCIHPYI